LVWDPPEICVNAKGDQIARQAVSTQVLKMQVEIDLAVSARTILAIPQVAGGKSEFCGADLDSRGVTTHAPPVVTEIPLRE
jgi:hypothetical protein